MQNEIFFSFSYLYSHLLVTLHILTILLRDPEGSGNIKDIILNWSTEKSLFVTECNTMVEGVLKLDPSGSLNKLNKLKLKIFCYSWSLV